MDWGNVAIVGATGAVGKEMISCLFSERFEVKKLFLFASNKSAGMKIKTLLGDLAVLEFSLDEIKESKCKIIFLAVSGEFSLEYSPKLREMGCVVIDNSSAFRYDSEIPLIVPEVNSDKIPNVFSDGAIIANPNCTTAILAMALYPLHKKYIVKKLICSTYQAASGAGEPGMNELEEAIKAQANGDHSFEPKVFSHNLCCNVIPCVDVVQDNDYTKEEMKLVWETQKIFSDPGIQISCTAVRVPTIRAHCISATIEFGREIYPETVRQILTVSSGVVVKDDARDKIYPVPTSASGRNDVEVGRIRQSLIFGNRGIDMFVCGDQLLRGAALNAVRIALCVANP
jgi:aspartate-semialdehyde dehydrogenase